METETHDVLIVGAGVSGLSAADRLRRTAPGLSVAILEGSDRAGGVVRTVREEGFLLEEGPDSFLTAKPAALEQCRALGLEPAFLSTDHRFRRSFILRSGRLLPVPEGVYLMAPTSLAALWGTRLFSLRGKLRMAAEPFIPRARAPRADESLGAFVRRRLGREALERLAQPMIAGIYAADPDRLSLAATFPLFLELERRYGSVIRGLRRRGGGAAAASGPRYGLFLTLKDGLSTWTDALARTLGGALRLTARATALTRTDAAWRVETADGRRFAAARLILATGAPQAARLLARAAPDLAARLAAIRHGHGAAAYLAFRRGDVRHPLDGMGFVAPAVEGMPFSACSFVSTKFPGRAPDGTVLLRVFIGGDDAAPLLTRDDRAVLAALRAALAPILGLSGAPLVERLFRHAGTMPHYAVGHLERVRDIMAAADALGGLALAGNAYGGVGLPDCVASGTAAADRVLETAGSGTGRGP